VTPFVLVAVFALGLLLTLFGAGFLGFLCIAGSAGVGGYFAVKNPAKLKP
jgi:hypothetical protein